MNLFLVCPIVNSVCVSLFTNCSMEINHLDVDASTGEFVVRYDLTKESSGEILATKLFEETIAYEETLQFIAEFNLADPEGISENLKCAFKTVTIPRKEVCT